MKLIYVLLLLILPFQLFANINGYTIKGKVIDSKTKEPLYGVSVITGGRQAETDINGEYSLSKIKSGIHNINTAYYSDYDDKYFELALNNDTTVNIELDEKALDLDEYVITGTRTPKRLSEAPIQTVVIGKKEIEQTAATTPEELLMNSVPGMEVSTGAMGTSINIKGLNTRYLLILVDGERLVNEGAGGSINLDQIDINTIERVEVLNDAASSLYGSNAVAGVINFITKKPKNKYQAGAKFGWEGNSFNNQYKANVNGAFKFDKTSLAVNAFRNSSTGYETDSATAFPYEDYGANLKFSYQPIKSLDLNARGKVFSHETFNPASSIDVEHNHYFNYSGGLNGTWRANNVENAFTFSANYEKYQKFDVLERKNDEMRLDTDIDYINARLTDIYSPIKQLELVFGAEYNREQIYALTTLGSTPTTKSVDETSVFAQADWKAFKGFEVIGGLRYTYNFSFGSNFSPKLSLMYGIKDWKFRAGAGTSYRAPSIKELYYDFDHSGMFWIYGNPDLKAEMGINTSASVEFSKWGFTMSAAGYYNLIQNKIELKEIIREDGLIEKHYENIGSVTVAGLDVSAAYTFLNQFTLKANYNFNNSIDNATGMLVDGCIEHSGTASFTWDGKIWKSPISMSLFGRVTSPKIYYEEDADGNLIRENSKIYNIWKIAIVKPFKIKEHTIEVSFKVDNIFNFQDPTYGIPGTMFYVGLRYAFN